MKKHNLIIILSLGILIPAGSRLSYAILLVLVLLFCFGTSLVVRKLTKRISLGTSGPLVELTAMAGIATLAYYLVCATFPVLAVALEMYIFLSAFSACLLLSIDHFNGIDPSLFLITPFSLFFLFLSTIREILGFATISIPSTSGIIELVRFPLSDFGGFGIWGSTSAGLILSGLAMWLFIRINRKLSLYRKKGA